MKSFYRDDWATIYHGDCRELLKKLDKVDLVLTDPPYGILNVADSDRQVVRKSPRQQGSGKLRDRILNTSKVEWDVAPTAEELNRLRGMSGHQVIWGGNYFDLPPWRCVLVWDKMQPWKNFSQVELAWTSLNHPAAIFRFDNRIQKLHPTQKPVELFLWVLRFFPKVETILDPFMGSGTTLVAAKMLGRRSIGIELEKKYCEIAARRLKATHAGVKNAVFD